MTFSTADIVAITGVSPNQLSKWIDLGKFALSEPQRSAHGVPRRFHPADVYELTFLGQLTRIGMGIIMACAVWRMVRSELHAPEGSSMLIVIEPLHEADSRVRTYRRDDAPTLPPIATVIDVRAVFDAADAAIEARRRGDLA